MSYVPPETETLTSTEFRDDLGPKLDQVQHNSARLILTRKGRKSAAVIPPADYETLLDAEYSALYSATLLNVTLDALAAHLTATTRSLHEQTFELAGGDAAAIARLLAEYRAAHEDNTDLCKLVDDLLCRTHLGTLT